MTQNHPFLEPFSFLLGHWSGEGQGLWSDGLTFEDALTFTSDGRPLIEFRQAARTLDDKPSHGELGYLLIREGGTLHMVVAEPSGITETLTGRADGPNRITLASVEIGHTPGTARVTSTARRLFLEGERLVVEVDIAVNGEALAPHTKSVLQHRGDAAAS
ncbi:MAG: nitrobindin family protein [Acidimicrobiales bacterium]